MPTKLKAALIALPLAGAYLGLCALAIVAARHLSDRAFFTAAGVLLGVVVLAVAYLLVLRRLEAERQREGWKTPVGVVVPIVPSEAMIVAGARAMKANALDDASWFCKLQATDAYLAMIAEVRKVGGEHD